VAVAGAIVIGNSALADGGPEHGFGYNLRSHRMTDLGTLGGSSSSVAAIAGDLVVGTSAEAGDQAQHAFVHDLRSHRTTDLGSLGGPSGSSAAVAVSWPFVVGNSALADGGPEHGFAYNLRTHRMTDLGTLGGLSSAVTGISGHTVVGTSLTGAGGHTVDGFAYDLRTGLRTDLGAKFRVHPLVSGNTVVGSDGMLGFSFDLNAGATATVGPGIGVTELNAVHGPLVIGDYFAANSFGFVYRTDTGVSVALPALGGLNSSASDAGPSGLVVGSAATTPPDPHTADGPYHAALWTPQTG
jgi:hypothetical protein